MNAGVSNRHPLTLPPPAHAPFYPPPTHPPPPAHATSHPIHTPNAQPSPISLISHLGDALYPSQRKPLPVLRRPRVRCLRRWALLARRRKILRKLLRRRATSDLRRGWSKWRVSFGGKEGEGWGFFRGVRYRGFGFGGIVCFLRWLGL